MIDGWTTKILGEICAVDWGNTDLTKSAYLEGGKFLAVSAAGGDGRIGHREHEKHTPVLSAIGAQCGRMFLPEEDFTAIKNTITLTPRDGVCTGKFLYQLLTHVELPKRGAAQPFIAKGDIEKFAVRIPPLPEQQQIVLLLEQAFATLAIAQANAEKNLRNARALFESHLQSVLKSKKWTWKTLGELCEGVEYGSSTKSKKEGKIPVLRMGNIQGGKFTWENLVYSDNDAENEKYLLNHNDVLFNRTNSPELVGKTAIYKSEMPAIFAGYLIRLHRKEGLLDADYLNYFLNSQIASDYGKTVAISSVNQANINGAKLKSYPIPVPSLTEQKKIVAQLDALASETRRLERFYQQKQVALAELKESILHQAFSGELTRDWRESKVLAFPVTIPDIRTTDLHAGILALAYRHHEKHGKQAEFGHVKGEKIIHLVEALVGIDLGRAPVKDAAGPNDFPHLQKVEHRAKMADYFRFQRVEGAAYRVTKLRKFDELITRTENALGERAAEVEKLLDTMRTMNMRQAEIFATVFAAWNNSLLDGKDPSDEAIVLEARENWHPDKLKIPREKFFAAITWMRDHDLAPKGRGKRVVEKVVRKK